MTVKTCFRALFATLCCSTLLACSPLMRGFVNNELVSTGYPPVAIKTSLPPLVEGQGSAFIITGNSMLTPDFWLGVYGAGDFASPMAITIYATAPNGYEWSPPTASYVDSNVIGTAEFGGQSFSSSIRVVRAAADPFALLVLPQETLKKSGADMYWLAQRYSDMSANFWKTKIILEYREPLPAGMAPNMDPRFSLATPAVQEFMKRAEAAFQVSFERKEGSVPRAPYIGKNIRQRYLGDFIGSLQEVEPIGLPIVEPE